MLIDNLQRVRVKKIVAGQNHSFVIDEDNNLICWGDNSHGQLGKGNKMTTSEIIMHSEKVLDVASKGL